MIELRSVVLHTGQNRMDVYVLDSEKVMRKIEISWFAREKTDTPPTAWWDSVVAEVEYQRAHDLEKKSGRLLF